MLRALVLVALLAVACGEPQRVPVNPPDETADSGVVAQADTGVIPQGDAGINGEADATTGGEADATTGEPDATIEEDAGELPENGWEGVRMIFQTYCRRCHDGVGRAWDVTDPRDLVGVNSGELPALQRIEAGSSERSFLFRKISGTQSAACTDEGSATRNCGARMPPSAAMLSAERIEMIKVWIEAGALTE